MTKHRRRRRRLEQEKKPEPAFVRPKEEKPAFFPKRTRTLSQGGLQLQVARQQALQLLETACYAIRGGTQDEEIANQSKALELAQQQLASDTWHIEDIQEVIHRIKFTVKFGRFRCHHDVEEQYDSDIDLGQQFHQLPAEERSWYLLKKVIAGTSLPVREGLPAGRYEHTGPAQTWVDYLRCLLQLLPEKPYLITGSPILYETKKPDDEEERWRRSIIDFFRRLFRRRRDL